MTMKHCSPAATQEVLIVRACRSISHELTRLEPMVSKLNGEQRARMQWHWRAQDSKRMLGMLPLYPLFSLLTHTPDHYKRSRTNNDGTRKWSMLERRSNA